MTTYTPETSDARLGRSTHSTALLPTETPSSGLMKMNRMLGAKQDVEDYSRVKTQTSFCEYIIESDRHKMRTFQRTQGSGKDEDKEEVEEAQPDDDMEPDLKSGCEEIAAYILSLNPSPEYPVRITMATYRPGSGIMRIGRKRKVQPPKTEVFYFDGVPKNKRVRNEKILRMLGQQCQQTLVALLFGLCVSTVRVMGLKKGIKFQTQEKRTSFA